MLPPRNLIRLSLRIRVRRQSLNCHFGVNPSFKPLIPLSAQCFESSVLVTDCRRVTKKAVIGSSHRRKEDKENIVCSPSHEHMFCTFFKISDES